jgi:hypothetical protein
MRSNTNRKRVQLQRAAALQLHISRTRSTSISLSVSSWGTSQLANALSGLSSQYLQKFVKCTGCGTTRLPSPCKKSTGRQQAQLAAANMAECAACSSCEHISSNAPCVVVAERVDHTLGHAPPLAAAVALHPWLHGGLVRLLRARGGRGRHDGCGRQRPLSWPRLHSAAAAGQARVAPAGACSWDGSHQRRRGVAGGRVGT